MQTEVIPEPARIGPFAEGDMLYAPVRRLTQVVFLGFILLGAATEWIAWTLRLD